MRAISGSDGELRMKHITKYVRNSNILTRSVDGEVFVLNPNQGFCTIEPGTGRLIWDLLEEGPCSIEELVDQVVNLFEVDQTTARKDIQEFIYKLRDKGVILELTVTY